MHTNCYDDEPFAKLYTQALSMALALLLPRLSSSKLVPRVVLEILCKVVHQGLLDGSRPVVFKAVLLSKFVFEVVFKLVCKVVHYGLVHGPCLVVLRAVD